MTRQPYKPRFCQKCGGRLYVFERKFCPDCKEEAYRENDRARGVRK